MYSQLLKDLFLTVNDTIDYFRIQDFLHGQRSLNRIINLMNQLLPILESKSLSEQILGIVQTLQSILETQKHNDTVLLADILEIQLLPYINILLQEEIISNETVSHDYLEKNLSLLENTALENALRLHTISSLYSVEQTNLGDYTIRYNGEQSLYFHSNVNPWKEGQTFASYYGTSEQLSYCVFGFGLGYHIRGLLNHDRRYQITILETNLDVLKIAFQYTDLSDILSNKRCKLQFCQPSNFNKFLNADSTLLIHYPSFQVISPGPFKDALHKYFITTSTMYAQGKLLQWNFYDNQQLQDICVDAIYPVFKDNKAVYVGGGPSLEYSMDKLAEYAIDESYIIICASTVYKILLKHNIVPDYVMMIDPQEHMVQHFQDTIATKTNLLYLCTAASNAVQSFPGTRYILFQKDYPKAVEIATKHSYTLFETGGSVSTLALDFLIRFGCKEIITLGLDLGHTDNKLHSFNPETEQDMTTFLQVESVAGGTIPTTHVLHSYQTWIEKRIHNESKISFINYSNGALIKGMQNIRLH